MSPTDPMPDSVPEPAAAPQPTTPPAGDHHHHHHDPEGLDLARALVGRIRRLAPDRASVRRRRRAPQDQPTISGAGLDDRDPQRLTVTIDRLIEERGWQTEARVHQVLARWPRVVGPQVADHCRPESFRDQVLTVRADSTAWRTHLTQLAADIVRRCNAELGNGTVARVVVLGPDAPSWRHGRRRVRGGRGPRDTYG